MSSRNNSIGLIAYIHQTRGIDGLISEFLKTVALVLLIVVDIIMLIPLFEGHFNLWYIWVPGCVFAYFLFRDVIDPPSVKCQKRKSSK